MVENIPGKRADDPVFVKSADGVGLNLGMGDAVVKGGSHLGGVVFFLGKSGSYDDHLVAEGVLWNLSVYYFGCSIGVIFGA